MSPEAFEKPIGFQDVTPTLARKKREMESRLSEVFSSWGYQEVMTPALEYAETVGRASAISEDKMFRLIGQERAMLVLRPDQTAPIARMVNSLLQHEKLPLRLFYHASVFRTQEQAAGRRAELYQSGVELIGEASVKADAELVALAISALQTCQTSSFRLVLGHVALLSALLTAVCPPEDQRSQLIGYLNHRDYVGFEALLHQLEDKKGVSDLLRLCRGLDKKEYLEPLLSHSSDQVVEAAKQLTRIWEILEDYGYESYLTVDIRLLGKLDYYTGMYFEGFAEGVGFAILSGGRYDQLYGQFGRSLPATGFAFRMNNLLETSNIDMEATKQTILYYPVFLRKAAITKAKELRESGYAVILQIDDTISEVVWRES
ncbi:ATP phosphoribosyltransferase regulatory subunit [Shimazuella kribbensis]|uniref:ATP phosphoribosyltransferase regulatory subunit n=1 Tax=Shimazuella kribbensis TaxID=139808 RepID=UPI00040C291E|nr:ATP phosphoribosyltransferase regulatory subunit [Shimazuella kribbensis]